jgi:hypothetical protein
MTTRERSEERKQFLTDLLITAVEHCGYGWFTSREYEPNGELGTAYAVIEEFDGEEWNKYHINLDTFARGLGVIRNAVPKVDERYPDDGEVLHNRKTGERLYLSSYLREDILAADRTNGEEGDIDVVGALAVLECGLFGKVV